MYGIFMECWVTFRNYGGTVIHMLLCAAAFIYLLVTEKDKKKKLMLVYMPIVVIVLFLCPLTRKVYVRLVDSATYYRMLWIIPMTVIIAYAGCRLVMRHRYTGTAAVAALIILTGVSTYKVPYISRAENAYHIPQYVVDICDRIMPEDGKMDVYAAVPSELTYYIRQYTSRICLIYGRDSVEPAWDYYDPVYEAMQGDKNKGGEIDTKALVELTRSIPTKQCTYIILQNGKKISEPLEDSGLIKIGSISGYDIYKDPVAEKNMEELMSKYR